MVGVFNDEVNHVLPKFVNNSKSVFSHRIGKMFLGVPISVLRQYIANQNTPVSLPTDRERVFLASYCPLLNLGSW